MFSFLWYQFKALDEKQSLATKLDIYKIKSVYHRNIILIEKKLLKSQKSYINIHVELRRQVKKVFSVFSSMGSHK